MRVLVVEPHLGDNGAVRVTLDRAQRWAQAGDEVVLFVVAHFPPEVSVQVPPGVRLVHSTDRPRRDLVVRLSAAPRMLPLVRAADVVVAGREIDQGLVLAAALTRLVRRPFAVTVQSRVGNALELYVPARLRRLNRWALRRADVAVCVSRGVVPDLQAVGVRAERTVVVHNGIDVADVRRRAALEPDVELPPGPLVVASGRLVHEKGFDLLVEAHALALRQGAPAHTVLVLGEGIDRPDLERRAQELGVAGSFLLAGHTSNPHAVVARADLFVLSSRWEGFPLGIMEALACGAPLVAADCVSGPREVLDDGAFGRLVPPLDVPALAQALHDHLSDPAPLRARAAAGAAQAEERFSAARAAQAHRDVLVGLLRERGRRWPARLTRLRRRVGRPASGG